MTKAKTVTLSAVEQMEVEINALRVHQEAELKKKLEALEQYEEFLKTYTKEQYEQEVREATVRLNELSTIAQGVLNEGVKLSKELGIEWTIELERGTVVPELSQYVDWQSSTIDCAKYY